MSIFRLGTISGVMLDFRYARPDDADPLAVIAAQTFPLACPEELPREAMDAFIRDHLDVASFRRYLSDSTHTVLCGVDPVGAIRAYALLVEGTTMDEQCAPLVLKRPTVGVSKFYLDPELHGSGAAASLLDAVATAASDSGHGSLWLGTNVGNARARKFYLKHGFVERGTRVFTVGGVDNTDVVLEKPL